MLQVPECRPFGGVFAGRRKHRSGTPLKSGHEDSPFQRRSINPAKSRAGHTQPAWRCVDGTAGGKPQRGDFDNTAIGRASRGPDGATEDKPAAQMPKSPFPPSGEAPNAGLDRALHPHIPSLSFCTYHCIFAVRPNPASHGVFHHGVGCSGPSASASGFPSACFSAPCSRPFEGPALRPQVRRCLRPRRRPCPLCCCPPC